MFSYYGSKSKIVKYYPKPRYNKIIEPFAGSARYSLRYFENDVLLVDKYQVIIDVWHYLQSCSPSDILKLPKLKRGETFKDNKQLSEIEKKFYGFITQAGSTGNRYVVGTMNGINIDRDLKQIASQLFKIKHWTIKLGSYNEIENEQATWFIDPPYQFGGHEYKFNNKQIDFTQLAQWCKTRNGQTIVCENTKSNWLPFKQMKKIQGAGNTNTTEAIWSNIKTAYDNEQTSLAI